jgi:hypothetical protein
VGIWVEPWGDGRLVATVTQAATSFIFEVGF